MTSLIVFVLGLMAGITLCWAAQARDSKPREAASHAVVEKLQGWKSPYEVTVKHAQVMDAHGRIRLYTSDGFEYQMSLTQLRGPK